MQELHVISSKIRIYKEGNEDYLSLSDMAKHKNASSPKDVIKNWMRARSTLEFLGFWEKLHNVNFKGVEFAPLFEEALAAA